MTIILALLSVVAAAYSDENAPTVRRHNGPLGWFAKSRPAKWLRAEAGAKNVEAAMVWNGGGSAPSMALEESAQTILSPQGDTPAESEAALRQRAVERTKAFTEAMRSLGYYGGTIAFAVDAGPPPRVQYDIAPGVQYTIAAVTVASAPDADGKTAPLPPHDAPALKAGTPMTSRAILDAEAGVTASLRARGYPYASAPDREVLVDHAAHTAEVHFLVSAGPKADFGAVEVSGLTSVHEDEVVREAPWHAGDAFDARLLDAYQKRLYARNLFSVVRVRTGDTLDASGRVPVVVEVTERPHRTVGLGAQYRSDDGPGVMAHWEHRNMFHEGHRLSFDVRTLERDLRLEALYEIPSFRRSDQKLVGRLELGRANTDAYDVSVASSEIGIERTLKEGLTLGGALGLRQSWESDDRSETYTHLYAPVRLALNRTNDNLDPTEGFRFNASATPYLELSGMDAVFVRAEAGISHYQPLDKDREWVVASRLRLGMMPGVSTVGVPSDLLYYAGGGGSVRGYAYQHAGPLDSEDDPIGGRSIAEMSVELRKRISEKFGAAVFLDGGSVFGSTYPDFNETMRWAAGLGMRYYTPLGPFRVDVAVPVSKRDSDDSFQFYISIGQAF